MKSKWEKSISIVAGVLTVRLRPKGTAAKRRGTAGKGRNTSAEHHRHHGGVSPQHLYKVSAA